MQNENFSAAHTAAGVEALEQLDADLLLSGVESGSFVQKLKSLYSHEIWRLEGLDTLKSIASVMTDVQGAYKLYRPLNVGGGGIAIQVVDTRLSDQHEQVYAVLKLPRPVAGQANELNEILHRETERLRSLRHQNLIRILTYGITPSGVYYYFMEFLQEPQDADEYLKQNPSLGGLIELLRAASRGLAYMHANSTAHLDIKPANIFVASGGESVVVADLGFAKRIQEKGETQYLGGTAGYKHPEHTKLIFEASRSQLDAADPNRQMRRSATPRNRIQLVWDVYSLGVTTLVLLRVLEFHDINVTSTYQYRYLKLMAHRMLGKNVGYALADTENIRHYGSGDVIGLPLVEEEYLGLRRDAMQTLQYTTMQQVLLDLDKLSGAADLLLSVPELSGQLRSVIQASSMGPVPFTDRIRQLLDTEQVRALGKVDQLGLVRLVYPSASHSRLEHSLGTMAMAVRFARALLSDPISPIFKQLVTASDIAVLLAVCLIHDIGHYPLAHDLEEVDRTIFGHERRTVRLLGAEGSDVRALLEQDSGWKIDIERLSAILSTDRPNGISLVDMIIRSIIDGPIDADKLDYLVRDSENLRLPYGRGIDVEKLLQCLTVVAQDSGTGTEARIGIHDRGRIPAESVAFARYALYGSVYWHRTHRTLKAMLNRLGFEVLFYARKASGRWLEGLRTDLDSFLEAEKSRQLSFRLDDAEDEEVKTSPYLDLSTQRMVWWLAARVPDHAFDDLASDILFRKLYKRVVVVTRSRPSSVNQDWPQAERIFGRIGKNWEHRREATTRLQQRLSELVAEWDGRPLSGHSSVDVTDASKFVLDAQSRPVVLIDYPPVKSGSATQLDYLRETEWTPDGRSRLRVDHLEASSMWASLIDQYSLGLGKLRVYVHPDHAEVVQAAVTRDEIERALWGALKAIRV